MVTIISIIAAGVFVVGVAAGIFTVVTLGIRREERNWSKLRHVWEDRFIQTGEVPDGYLPEAPPDPLSGSARRLTGLYVRRDTDTTLQDSDYGLRV
ncbi:MAG TPA: hypothetical protein VGS19_16875 [Streptosporangiaceae bacterium]|nr:hypothetical protein [Streptosporangiaceae bacterium]